VTSCFSELRYAIYVDGELAPQERRTLEAHLVQCRDCRALVVALQEEAALLGEALGARAPAASAALATRPDPARGLALGVGPALALALGLVLGAGWLLETLRPLASRWIGPFTLRGTTDMAFDLLFLLRDEVPGLLGAGVAVAAMASASALLTYVLSVVLRRWSGPRRLALLVLVSGLSLALPVGESHAHFGMHGHEDYILPAGETHDGSLLVWAQNASIDGVVDGDLISFSHQLTIRGEVRGNVLTVARGFELPGSVQGSVYVAAGRSHVSGEVRDNLYAFTEVFTLNREGRLRRDGAVLAETAVFEGDVGRDLYLLEDRVELRGAVGRNVAAWTDRLAILDSARIDGDVRAALPRGREVELAPGARIGGELSTSVRKGHHRPGFSRFRRPALYAWMALHVAAAFVVGMLLHALAPGAFGARLETAGAFFRSLGVGFLVLVASPLALALLGLTLVGLPAALIGLAAYLVALYLAGILVAALVGSALVRSRNGGGFGLALLAGLVVLVLLAHVPVLGALVRSLAILSGLGLLAERARLAWSLRGTAAA